MTDARRLQEVGILPPAEDLTWTDETSLQETLSKLQERGWITPYQSRLILAERDGELRVGNYVILDRIGEGGMGQVFLACSVSNPTERVVLKTILAGTQQRQDREARLLMSLRHSCIVPAIDYFTESSSRDSERSWLVMQWLAGPDLAAWSRQHGPAGRDSELTRKVVCWMWQAARGLAAAHEAGIIHRDIKPSNLILDENQNVKVTDFGIARHLASELSLQMTATGQLLGTTDFMAPEQAKSASKVDGRADLYSLGCTLFFLLEGRTPYVANNVVNMLVQHAEAPLPSLSNLVDRHDRRWLQVLIHTLIAKEPSNRLESARELANCVRSFLSGQHRLPLVRVRLGMQRVTRARRSSLSKLLPAGFRQATPWYRPIRRSYQRSPVAYFGGLVFLLIAAMMCIGYQYGRSNAGKIAAGSRAVSDSSIVVSVKERVGTQAPQRRAATIEDALVPAADLIASGQWEWRVDSNLGAPINSVSREGSGSMAPDGKSLFFASNREGGHGNQDLWMVTRPNVGSAWSDAINLGNPINTPDHESHPSLADDGKHLSFTRRTTGGSRTFFASRSPTAESWSEPVAYEENSKNEHSSFLTSDGLTMLVSSPTRGGNGLFGRDLWIKRRGSLVSAWEKTTLMPEPINTNLDEIAGTISNDGRLLIVERMTSDLKVASQIWMSTRSDWDSSWLEPKLIETIEIDATQSLNPHLTSDGRSFLYSTSRPDGLGSRDIWLARLVRKSQVANGSQAEQPTAEREAKGFALSFDGNQDYVAIPSLFRDPRDSATLELWCTPLGPETGVLLSGGTSLIAMGASPRNGSWYRGAVFDDDRYRLAYGGNLMDQHRVHLAVVWSDQTLIFFQQGKRFGRSLAKDFAHHGHLRWQPYAGFVIGGLLDSEGNIIRDTTGSFDGTIDELRISNGARYTKEFSPVEHFEMDEHTEALFHFNEGRGSELVDSSGNGHHGRIVGAQWVNVGGTAIANLLQRDEPTVASKTVEPEKTDDVIPPDPASIIPAELPSAPEVAIGQGEWVSLFDGETLDGWESPQDVWSVVDGAIKGNGSYTPLFLQIPVGDFELRAEVKINRDGNSGVFFYFDRSHKYDATSDPPHEIQIVGSAKRMSGNWLTGSYWARAAVEVNRIQDDEWFTMHIRADGSRVNVKINGQQVLDHPLDVVAPQEPTRLGLQCQGSETVVWFRNLQLKRL